MIRIFLSYRRADTADVAGRLYDNLRMKLGDDLVFRDVYDIDVGIDWHVHIDNALRSSDAVLAIIGPTWLTATDGKGRRRLDNTEDPVRKELDLALRLVIPIIPVLVGNARMPAPDDLPDPLKSLSRLNAAPLRDTDFQHDFDRLSQAIKKYAHPPHSPGKDLKALSNQSREPMSAETTVFKLLRDMISALERGYVAEKKAFFEAHVEPLHQRMVEIHKDYVAGFQEIARHLKERTTPPSKLLDFLKERRRLYEHERRLAQDLARELGHARKAGISDDLWRSVQNYSEAIMEYFSATAKVGGFTWYSEFLRGVEGAIRAGFGEAHARALGEDVWREAGFSGHPRIDLLHAVELTLDHDLPRAFQKISSSYAILRARLL
jgi:TIR domain